jgi:hypothetical protein
MEKLKSIGTSILVVVAGVLVANMIQQKMSKAKLSSPTTK